MPKTTNLDTEIKTPSGHHRSGTATSCGLYEVRAPTIQCSSLSIPWVILGGLPDFYSTEHVLPL